LHVAGRGKSARPAPQNAILWLLLAQVADKFTDLRQVFLDMPEKISRNDAMFVKYLSRLGDFENGCAQSTSP